LYGSGPWGSDLAVLRSRRARSRAEAAGFKVIAAVESNHDAADTMEKNFFCLHTPVIRR